MILYEIKYEIVEKNKRTESEVTNLIKNEQNF